MIAYLPMYDWPEVRNETDAFWRTVRLNLSRIGISAPDRLARSEEEGGSWLAPDLLLGQACGYPLATSLKGKVQYVTTPVYNVEGCKGANYSSVLVTGKNSDITLDRLATTCLAFNSNSSLSGYRALRTIVGDPRQCFANFIETGGHRQSARAVANGEADIAALDAVCWHLLQQHEPETASSLKPIGWTKLLPSLPLITSLKTSKDVIVQIREALMQVIAAKENEDICRALALGGFKNVDISNYYRLAELG